MIHKSDKTTYISDDGNDDNILEDIIVAELQGSFKLDLNFTEDLNDPNSAEYQRQAREFCGAVSTVVEMHFIIYSQQKILTKPIGGTCLIA